MSIWIFFEEWEHCFEKSSAIQGSRYILKGILFFAFSKELLYEGRLSANLGNGHDELYLSTCP